MGSVGLQLLGGVTLGVTTKIVTFFVRNLVESLVLQNHTMFFELHEIFRRFANPTKY